MITMNRAHEREQMMLFPDVKPRERLRPSQRWEYRDDPETVQTSYFDGGCSGNGTSLCSGYGSFTGAGGKVMRRHYGVRPFMSNNVAELQTAVEALRYWVAMSDEPAKTRVILVGDSQLAINCLAGRWKLGKEHLRAVVREFDQLKAQFSSVVLRWVPRERIVPILGH